MDFGYTLKKLEIVFSMRGRSPKLRLARGFSPQNP
jgi:hypothetical protein